MAPADKRHVIKDEVRTADVYLVDQMSVTAVSVTRPEVGRRANEVWFSAERQLPAARRIVLYQTATSQQLGYLDEGRRWRRLNGQTETDAVISWVARKGTVSNSVKSEGESRRNTALDTYDPINAGASAVTQESFERIS